MMETPCTVCGTPMKGARENFKYDASGLDNVTLTDVLVYRCPKCGEFEVEIPAIAALHRELAKSIARAPERLGPKEVRFLRTYLGLSSSDFARKMGVDPSTVSRWESVESPHPMGGAAERVLRLMVLTEKPVSEYPLEEVATKEARPVRRVLAADSKGRWHEAA